MIYSHKNVILKIVKIKTLLAFILFCFFGFSSLALAATPEVTSLNPDTCRQDWLGTITVTGNNFEIGASFEVNAPDSIVYTTTLESSTTLEALVYIGSFEAVGTKEITITNPGGESVTPSNILFTVVAASTAPAFSTVYFDGTAYTGLEGGIPSTEVAPNSFEISFEVTGSVSMTAYPAQAASIKAFANYSTLSMSISSANTTYDFVPADLTQVDSGTIGVEKTFTSSILSSLGWTLTPGSTPVITLFAQDDHGNQATQTCVVQVLIPAGSGPGWVSNPSRHRLVRGAPRDITYDPDKGQPFEFTLDPQDDYYIQDGFWVLALQGVGGGRVIFKRFFAGVYTQSTTLPIPAAAFRVVPSTTGIITFIIIDNVTKQRIGTFKAATCRDILTNP